MAGASGRARLYAPSAPRAPIPTASNNLAYFDVAGRRLALVLWPMGEFHDLVEAISGVHWFPIGAYGAVIDVTEILAEIPS